MKRNFTTPGIILRSRSVGEKNRLLDIITPDAGIIRATAYGALSPRSSLRSRTQSFFCGEMFFYREPVKGFVKLSDADIHEEFSNLREHVKVLYAASLMAEIMITHYWGNQDDPRPYRLLYSLLYMINKIPESYLDAVNLALWRYLEIIGEQPDATMDIKGHNRLSGPARYLFREGGFTGGNPGAADDSEPRENCRSLCLLQYPEMEYIRNEKGRDLAYCVSSALPDEAGRRLFGFLSRIYEYSATRPLKSLRAGVLP